MTNEDYCVLRVPISTRDAITKIAERERFKPTWTTVANELLLQGIRRYEGMKPDGEE